MPARTHRRRQPASVKVEGKGKGKGNGNGVGMSANSDSDSNSLALTIPDALDSNSISSLVTSANSISNPSPILLSTLAELQSLSALVSRYEFARAQSSGYGITFDGRRDLFSALGYAASLSFSDYYARYRRGGIARRIVNLFPDSLWTDGIAIVEDEDVEVETQFELALESLLSRIPLYSLLHHAHVLSLLGRYSTLLLGVAERKSSGSIDWSTEIRANSLRFLGPDSILYLNPLNELQLKVDKLELNPSSPRFGLPLYYSLNMGASNPADLSRMSYPTPTLDSRTVHWSRVFHVADNVLDYDLYAIPILESVWNYLDDLDKNLGGGSEAAWRRMDPGIHANVPIPKTTSDIRVEVSEEQETKIEAQLLEYVHGIKRFLFTQGVDVEAIPSSRVDFATNADSLAKFVAASLDIPVRKLMGTEEAKLAGDQDDKGWNRTIKRKMSRFGSPLLNEIIARFIYFGVLPKPSAAKGYQIIWPLEDEDSEKDKVTNAEGLSRANKSNVDAGLGPVMLPNEIRDRFWGMEPLEEEVEVEDNEEELEMEDEEPVTSDTPADDASLLPNAQLPRRICILGGPRRSKSTMAMSFRAQGIPTYCTDPESLVKDKEIGVTYLPEGMDWSEGSAYVAKNWLTLPGPWCVEGVGAVRALRKYIQTLSKPLRDKLLEDSEGLGGGLEVFYINNPVANTTPEQERMAKGIRTMWDEIRDMFPRVKYMDTEPAGEGVTASGNAKGKAKPKSNASNQRLDSSRVFRVSFRVR